VSANPSPSQILAALRGAGVDVKPYKNWDTIGRPWKGPDGSPGLTGAVVHHTATASATGSKGAPSLYWAVTAYDRPVCNLLVGRGPGDTYLLSAGSAYHCGDGGPVPALGVPSRGFLGQTRFFGIEIDDPGKTASSMTPYQIENTARTLAALAELCDWDVDKAIGTHKCYTDGCHGWNPKGPSATLGRKNDTIDGPWRSYPGNPNPEPYNAPWWREQTKMWMEPPVTWDGTVPTLRAVQRAEDKQGANRATWRVACRLFDLGFKQSQPAEVGRQRYPSAAIVRFRRQHGIEDVTGEYDRATHRLLFGKDKP
jgi:hypothetical protein